MAVLSEGARVTYRGGVSALRGRVLTIRRVNGFYAEFEGCDSDLHVHVDHLAPVVDVPAVRPRVGTLQWFVENPHRGSIYNTNFQVDGARSDRACLNPWVAVDPNGMNRFGTLEAARRHLIGKGWRK